MVFRNSWTGFLMLSLPHEITQGTFFSQQQKCSNMYERFSAQGQGLATWSCRHALSSARNPRLQERKQVFSMNHIVCTNSLSTVNHLYQGKVRTLPKFKFVFCSFSGLPALAYRLQCRPERWWKGERFPQMAYFTILLMSLGPDDDGLY